MSGRYLALRYAIIIATNEVLRSQRWSEADKTFVLFCLGAMLSGPAVVSAALWVLTGRGPYRWLVRPFVNPFGAWLPKDMEAVRREWAERAQRTG